MQWLSVLGGPGLVLAAAILLINTTVAAWFAQKSKHLQRRSRRLSRIEPVHLDMMEWAYDVRQQAASQGRLRELPPLPPSLADLAQAEAQEPGPIEPTMLRRLGFPGGSSAQPPAGSGENQ